MQIRQMTLSNVSDYLEYNPTTGLLTWLVDIYAASNKLTYRKGTLAARAITSAGYHNIKIGGISYQAHNIAYLLMTGSLPRNLLDHKDLDKLNNKWNNIREATHSQNGCNTTGVGSNTGIKGLHKGTASRGLHYVASIKHNGKQYKKSIHCSLETEQVTISTLTKWLQNTREYLHGEFANHG